MDFVGNVDTLLAERLRPINGLVVKLQRPPDLDPVITGRRTSMCRPFLGGHAHQEPAVKVCGQYE